MYQPHFKSFFEKAHEHATKKVAWKTCPYPKGPNEVKDYLIDNVDALLPPYIPGSEKWKFEMRFFKNNVDQGGYNLYAIIRNEKSLLGN